MLRPERDVTDCPYRKGGAIGVDTGNDETSEFSRWKKTPAPEGERESCLDQRRVRMLLLSAQ